MRTAGRLILLLVLLAGFAKSGMAAPAAKITTGAHHRRAADLADTIDGNVILSKFAKLVGASDMGTFYSSRGPFTLFAPTNSAFSKLPPGMFEDMLRPENKAQLQRIVLFHLVNGKAWFARDLKMQKSLVSCEGTSLDLKTTKAGTLFVHKAKVLRSDEHCVNGVLDEIDTLLMPPQLVLQAGSPVDASTNAAPPTNAPDAEVTNPQPVGGTNAVPAGLTGPPSATTNAPPVSGTNTPTTP